MSCKCTYKNDGVMTWRLGEDNIGALNTVHHGISFDIDFGEKF
jgi:hypothetical protein